MFFFSKKCSPVFFKKSSSHLSFANCLNQSDMTRTDFLCATVDADVSFSLTWVKQNYFGWLSLMLKCYLLLDDNVARISYPGLLSISLVSHYRACFDQDCWLIQIHPFLQSNNLLFIAHGNGNWTHFHATLGTIDYYYQDSYFYIYLKLFKEESK